MNFPNTLSVLRILLSPVFVWLFLSGSPMLIRLSVLIFTVAALTDWYDGWYARKYGFKTRWGQFLDPLADKILTSSAFIGFLALDSADSRFFGQNEPVPVAVLAAVIILRDIVLTAVRSYKELKGSEFRTSFISKTKTFAQMTYIFIVIGFFAAGTTFGNSESGKFFFDFLYSDLNYYLLFAVTILTVLSGIAYVFEARAGESSAAA